VKDRRPTTSHKLGRLFFIACTAALAALTPLTAATQDYPSRTITLVVPFAPGGGVDVMARLLAETLRPALGQQIIVENKPGAGAMLGAQYVTRASADGYTLLLGSAGETAINQYVFKDKMSYQPDRDLVPVALVARVPNVLVAGKHVQARNVAELLAWGRANPGKLSYATSGVGNPQHLNGALLALLADVPMLHVPYRGAAAQLADVVGGVVDLTFTSYAGAKPFIQADRVNALAVTSATRASFAPDIPAISETPGLESYALSNWFGVFAPRGTPKDVVTTLNQAIVAALRNPDLAKSLSEQGGEIEALSETAFADFIQTENLRYAQVVERAHIVPE